MISSHLGRHDMTWQRGPLVGTSAGSRPRLSGASSADAREKREHSADWGGGGGAHPRGTGFCFFSNSPLLRAVGLELVSQVAHAEGALGSGTLCVLEMTGAEDSGLPEGDLTPVLGKELETQEALGGPWAEVGFTCQVWRQQRGPGESRRAAQGAFPVPASFWAGLGSRGRRVLRPADSSVWFPVCPGWNGLRNSGAQGAPA